MKVFPVAMEKLSVVVMKDDVLKVLKFLQEDGSVEISQQEDVRVSAPEMPQDFSRISEQISKLQSIESLLPKQEILPQQRISLDKALAKAESIQIGKRILELKERKDKIESDLKDDERQLSLLKEISGFGFSADSLKAKSLKFFIGKIPKQKLEILETNLSRVSPEDFILAKRTVGKLELLIALGVRNESAVSAREILEKIGFVEEKVSVEKGEKELALEINSLKHEGKKISVELDEISKKYYAEVIWLKEMLEIEKEKFEAYYKLGATSRTAILELWVKRNEIERLKKKISELTSGKAYFENVKSNEAPPVELDNPGILKPFQFLVEFYSLPNTKEIDPTLLFALSFSLYYGLIVGDFGYGLVSLILSWLIVKKFKEGLLHEVGKVWMISAIPAMFFGIVFGEFFGFEYAQIIEAFGLHETVFASFHPFVRIDNISQLLVISAGLGVVFVTIGLLIGAFLKLRSKKFLDAFAKISWIGIEFSVIILAGIFMFAAFPAEYSMPALILLAVSVLVLLIAEFKHQGPLGIIFGLVEIPSLISNILSFTRIAALGLAGLMIAYVINELLAKPEYGLLFFILLPVIIFAHLFNVVLGMVEALIQSARLNYVETFGKFFTGGGRKFNKFEVKSKNSIIRR